MMPKSSQKGAQKGPKRLSKSRFFEQKWVQEAISVHTPFRKRFWTEFSSKFDRKYVNSSALACTAARFFKDRCFDDYIDSDTKKHPKMMPKSSMLGQLWLQNRYKNYIKFYFNFWYDFGWIWGRFWERLGTLLDVFGGSRGCPEGVFWQPLEQGGPRRVSESDLEGFWLHFGRVWAPFWEILGRIFQVVGVIWAQFWEDLGTFFIEVNG